MNRHINPIKTALVSIIILLISACNVSAQCNYFTRIVSGSTSYHTLGIKNDGTLWSWGDNTYGEIGDGTTNQRNIPTPVTPPYNWIALSAGALHSLGITSDGKLWAWGDNSYGELGNSTATVQKTPVQIGTDSNWIAVAAGYGFSLGITADGKLWAWGYNNFGQLGDGTTNNQSNPEEIGNDSNWVSIAAGNYHSLGITSDGKLWAWGNNGYGQLGNGTTTQAKTPTQVEGTDSNWMSISGGYYFSLGITSDGKLWAWGYNSFGQLGIGSLTSQSYPTQAGTASNWVSVSAGNLHTLGITSDGKLWAWGYNNYGQLGDGTTNNQSSPEQIGSAPVYSGLAAGGTISTQYQQSLVNYASDCNDLIATVSQKGYTPISGNTTAKVWIENTQPLNFVARHYEINPANNASTSTGRVTLYCLQSEFDAFNNQNPAPPLLLPTGPNDNTGISNLIVEKRDSASMDGTGLPDSYTGVITDITPNPGDVVWNSTYNRWEISFDLSSFSGFFITTQSIPVPVNWMHVTAQLNTFNQPQINWAVQESNTTNYQVQYSTDGIHFSSIGTINSKGNDENNYQFTQLQTLEGTGYYRILQTDKNGLFTYSRILKLSSESPGFITAYPQPFTNSFTIQNTKTQQALITDMNGRILTTLQLPVGNIIVNASNWANGMYILKSESGENIKLIKQ